MRRFILQPLAKGRATRRAFGALAVLWALFPRTPACAEQEDPVIEEKPLSQWLKQLRSDNRGFQLRAAQALSKATAQQLPAIVPQVAPLLKSDRENDRFVAAQTLGNYGPAARAAVADLIPLLEGTQFERNRAAAAKALGQILKDAEPGEEVEKVAQALTRKINEDWDKYGDVRREAAYALGMIGPAAKSCVPKLTRVLDDRPPSNMEAALARKAAAWTCGRMGPLAAEQVDRLISLMHSDDHGAAPESVEALGLIGLVHENVLLNIMDRLEGYMESGWGLDFRIKAFEALAQLGHKAAAAVPLLRRCLRRLDNTGDKGLKMRLALLKALAAIGPAAKEAAPEIEAHLHKPVGGQVADFTEEEEAAARAYKAVTGNDPPKNKPAGK